MDYTSIFDPIPWDAVGHSVIQTIIIYWVVLIGLKLVGRRVFGEMGPQDLIVLLLIAESCDLGLSNEKAGFWGTIASVLTILTIGGTIERSPWLRRLLEENKIELYRNGQLDWQKMERCLVEESDLEKMAREYGLGSYEDFEVIILENDGSLTGVITQSPQRRSLKQLKKPV